MPNLDRLKTALADRYVIEREIGAGGMATVYLAEDLKHKRKVAVKVLRPELAAVLGPERFLREIETTANLNHPHILPLFDSGEADSFLYFVMPYVEGESLREKLNREKPLAMDEALKIAKTVAGALGYAHEQGVIHRDIKPANILLHKGEVLVADFGVALAVQTVGEARLTDTRFSPGTPHYMSPEQAGGEANIDGRSDLYSLACVLFEMLVGEPPFTGPNVQAILARQMNETPPSLRVVRASIPEGVERAVEKALAKTPADRFKTAGEFGTSILMVEPVRPRRLAAGKWLVSTGIVAVVAIVLVMAGDGLGRGKMSFTTPDSAMDEDSSVGTQTGDSRDTRILVVPGELRLAVGASEMVLVTAFDANDDVVPGASFEWESSNPSIAMVWFSPATPNIGNVEGVRPGIAVVRVDHGNVWSAVSVAVGKIFGGELFDENVEIAGRLLLNSEVRGELSATEDAAYRGGELVEVWDFEGANRSRVLLRVIGGTFPPRLKIQGPGLETLATSWQGVTVCGEITVTLAEAGVYRVAVESREPFLGGGFSLGLWASDVVPAQDPNRPVIQCTQAQVL